jgi:hypothetical protein
VALCLAAVGVVSALLASVGVVVGISDQQVYGPLECPQCRAHQKIRPWSL